MEPTAMEVLSEQPFSVLESLYRDVVCDHTQIRHEGEHILSTRAYSSGERTKYPVLREGYRRQST